MSVTLPQVSLGVATVALSMSVVSILMIFTIYRVISKITIGKDSPRIDRLLGDLLSHLESSKREQRVLKELLMTIQQDEVTHIQHVGLVRFNPFPDTGGNQSFTLALLDGQRNGFVISSLHGREGTRLFAKTVRVGQEAEYPLSHEEQQAVKEALKR